MKRGSSPVSMSLNALPSIPSMLCTVSVPAIVAICAEPHSIPGDLATVLANHTLIHTAEGELYREALEEAAEWLGLPVLQVRAKRVGAAVAEQLGMATDRQQAVLAALGKELGPPWRADHKQATLLAAMALEVSR